MTDALHELLDAAAVAVGSLTGCASILSIDGYPETAKTVEAIRDRLRAAIDAADAARLSIQEGCHG